MPNTPPTDQQHRAILQRIAQRAMLERGLLPTFLEAASAVGPAGELQLKLRQERDNWVQYLADPRFDEVRARYDAPGRKASWWFHLTEPPAPRTIRQLARQLGH